MQKLLNVDNQIILPVLVSEQAVIIDCSTGKFSQNFLKTFTAPTLHSLCQECRRKFPGQHCIKNQHCAEPSHKSSGKISARFKPRRVAVLRVWTGYHFFKQKSLVRALQSPLTFRVAHVNNIHLGLFC